MSSSKRRLSHNLTNSANKLKLDSINKILKIDSVKGKRQRKDAISKQVSRIALAELIRNTSQTPQIIPPDFKTFLNDEENVNVFKEFLKASYCQENLDFYLACEKYRKLDSDLVGKQMIKFMAIQIYNDFLGDDAREQVNVASGCREQIKLAIKNPQPDLFRDAQAEIFNLMKTDCYPRFCRTWQLDKDMAQKILTRSAMAQLQEQSSPQKPTVSFATTNASSATDSVDGTFLSQTPSMRSSSGRTMSSKSQTPSARSRSPSSRSHFSSNQTAAECPPECPYFRIGRLPCQEHRATTSGRLQTGALRRPHNVDHVIDLKRIHQVPEVCTRSRRTPPPPPLPPKPQKINQIGLSLKPIDPYLPYVGKVFHV